MSKNSILPIIFKRHQKSSNYQQQAKNTVFSGKTAKKEQIRTKYGANTGKKSLEKSNNPAYLIYTVVKNSNGWDLQPKITRDARRIFRGFFYACKMCRVMIDHAWESSDSPFSSGYYGTANRVWSVYLQFAVKETDSNLTRGGCHYA